MKITKTINLSKKFLAFIFTFCMMMHTISCIPLNFSFAMGINSNKKIYIGEILCIDEATNPEVKNYENNQFKISYNDTKNSYILAINPNANIGAIYTEGKPNIIIKTNGNTVINSHDDFSINGVNNLIIFDEKSSDSILDLKGGINFSGSLEVYRNTRIGNDYLYANRGIEGGQNIVLENAILNIYTKPSAIKNISEKISVGNNSQLKTISDLKAFDSVKKLVVKESGKVNISSKDSKLDTPMYSSWALLNDKLWNDNSPIINEKTADYSLSDQLQAQNKYAYKFTENSNGYNTCKLSSLEEPMIRLSYGTDIFGIEKNTIGGKIEVISGIGQKLYSSEAGEFIYKLKANSNAIIRITPNNGYQINSDVIKKFNLTSTGNENEYIINIPNYNIELENIFIGQGNIINLLSSTEEVRKIEAKTRYNNETLNIIIEDKNDVLTDDAVLEVTPVEKDSDRYKELIDSLDDKSEVEHRAFFDIVIYKDDTKQDKYSELTDKVKVLFQIPQGWDKNELQAVLVHSISDNNKSGTDVEFSEEVVTKDGIDYLSFETDHFSPYAFLDGLSEEELEAKLNELSDEDLNKLMSELENIENNSQEPSENAEADVQEPEAVFATGDNTKTIITCLIVVAIVSLVAFITLKKFEKKNEF